MQEFTESFRLAFNLVLSLDEGLLEIIALSMRVSLSAVALGCLMGLPLGAVVAVGRFKGRYALLVLINALMGMPPVVLGLLVYMLLSNAGPLAWLQLLYSPSAMIIAQTLLITPIVAALSAQIVGDLYADYKDQLLSMSVPRGRVIWVLLLDARFSLLTVALAGFGRAIAEVGAVMIVGGNIDHLTRVMTTAIALETSKGDLALALALGMVLMAIALIVNAAVMTTRLLSVRGVHA
jgi:tungstate transport system permease protein